MFSTELWNVGQHGIGYIHLQRLNGFLNFILSYAFLMILAKDKEKFMETGKNWAWRVLRTEILWTNFRYRTRQCYLMFSLKYARIQKLIFIGLLFYQNQTKWDCQKLCIVLVIACAICTVILSDGFLLLSKGYVKCPECLHVLWIFFKKHAFLLTNK